MSADRRRDALMALQVFAFLACALGGVIHGDARADDRGAVLAHLVPAKGLSAYLEYDGLDRHAEAWNATAAWHFLNATPAGKTMANAAAQAFDRLLTIAPPYPLRGSQLVGLQEHVIRHGFAYAALHNGGRDDPVWIVRGLGGAERKDLVRDVVSLMLSSVGWQDAATAVQIRGRTVHVFVPKEEPIGIHSDVRPVGSSWWVEGETLIYIGAANSAPPAIGDHDAPRDDDPQRTHRACVERVLDAIDGRTPNASTHPLVVAACNGERDIRGFEPSGIFVAESRRGAGVITEHLTTISGVGSPASAELVVSEALGVAQARRVVVRWGFRGKALLTDARFEEFDDPKTARGLLDATGIGLDRLPPMPRRTGAFFVATPQTRPRPEVLAALSASAKVRDADRRLVEAATLLLADPKNRQALDGVLDRVGPAWWLFAAPVGATGDETSWTLATHVEDMDACANALDAAASQGNAFFRDQEFGEGDASKTGTRVPAIVVERLPAPDRGYRLASHGNRVPWLTNQVQPTILLGKSIAVIAMNPKLARAAVAAEREATARWEPSNEAAGLLECLPARPALLIVGNPRDSFWPEAIVSLPQTAAPALARFAGVDPARVGGTQRQSEILSLIGVKPDPSTPTPVGRLPLRADDLRSRLFPSVVAVTKDDRSVRILALEAFPFGCLGVTATHGGANGMAISIGFRSLPGN